MSTPVIFDPTNGTARPAHSFHRLGQKDGLWLLEGATGDLFRFNPRTFESGDVMHVTYPLDESDGLAFNLSEAVDDIVLEGIDDPHVLRAIFLAGAGGAGKGRVGATMFAGTGLKIIDQDKHLERFMAAAKLPLSDVGLRYDLLKKAQRLKNAEIRQYGSRRLGIVIDSTGWEYERIEKPVKKLRNLGYDCYMVFVSAPLDVSLARNKARAAAGGRAVPDSFIKQAHRGSHENLPDFQKLFGQGNVVRIDNAHEIEDGEWSLSIAPKLRKIANKILSRPIKNPRGKAWLKAQSDPETATDPKPATEWPADAVPVSPPFAFSVPPKAPALPSIAAPVEPATGASVPKGSPAVKGGWNSKTKRFEGVDDLASIPADVLTEWVLSGGEVPLAEWLKTTHPALVQ